jgi:hypothetical protein
MSSTQTPRARRPFILPDSARTPSIPSIHTPPGKTQVRGKGYDKLASFSPGIDAMNAPYSPEAAQAQFDASITQSMYQRFGSKFPDLVPSLVTLRLLASDVDTGTAFGAFVLDIGDRVVYVPAVVNDSRLEELDIVYDKTTDQFAPLTLQQLRYLRNRGTNPMGTAEKLPQSVPTDVDIRALMLPPETGRYSYASADEMPSLAKRLPIEKTAGFAPEMAYASPKRQLEEAVLQHLAKSAPEVFDHLPEEQRAALLGQSGSDPMAPEMTPHVPHGHDGPVPGTIRTASAPHADFDADLAHMRAKIAAYRTDAVTKRASGPSTKLLSFLEHSPNAVKTAFVETMKADKHLASTIFRHYGPMKVAAAVRRRPPGTSILAEKRASVAEIPFRLGVATKEVEVQAFGPDSGKALRGVKLRGYYYRTEGMAPNRAITEPTTKNVATQVPRSGEAGAGLTGVLMLMKRDGGREAVLVISQPYDLDYGDAWDARSITQPSNASWPVAGALAAGMTGGQGPLRPERGRKNLIVWGDTSHTEVTCDVFGDPVPDSTLEGTKLWASLKAMGKPKLGRGIFLSKSGATIDGTSPLVIKTISTGPDGITRGTFQGGRSFECDPLSAIEKIVHTSAYDTLYLPASWKWVSLGEQRPERSWDGAPSVKSDYYLTSEDAAHALMHSLVSKSERASVMGDGISYVTSASPGMGKTKVAALVDLSKRYGISGADAEALLKMADVAGRSSALIVPRSGQLKKAAGPLEAAFGATLQDLQAQLQQLQGQISALTGVQQRASAMLSASPGGADPLAMQMTDPGMGAPAPGDAPMPDPAAMAADPAAAGAAPMRLVHRGADAGCSGCCRTCARRCASRRSRDGGRRACRSCRRSSRRSRDGWRSSACRSRDGRRSSACRSRDGRRRASRGRADGPVDDAAPDRPVDGAQYRPADGRADRNLHGDRRPRRVAGPEPGQSELPPGCRRARRRRGLRRRDARRDAACCGGLRLKRRPRGAHAHQHEGPRGDGRRPRPCAPQSLPARHRAERAAGRPNAGADGRADPPLVPRSRGAAPRPARLQGRGACLPRQHLS